MDPGIPGSSTHDKPERDIRKPDNDDEPISRVDDANDLTKDRNRIDTREDNADKHDGIGYNGEGPSYGTGKTTYPYREDRPHTKLAHWVAQQYLASQAPTLTVYPTSRVAATLGDMQPDRETARKAKACRVSLRKNDTPAYRWTYAVDCGNGAKAVKVEGQEAPSIEEMPLRVACSCPAWQWQGPEHHARQEGYLQGRPRGTASAPRERDPRGQHRVCKHVAAVLGALKRLSLPRSG